MNALPLEPQLAHSNPQAFFILCRPIVMLQHLDEIIHFHAHSCVQQKNISMLFLFQLVVFNSSVYV